MAQTSQLILFARDEMTPVVTGAAKSVDTLTTAVRGLGSASAEQRRASAEFYDNARQAKKASEEAAQGFDSMHHASRRLAKEGLNELTGGLGLAGHALLDLGGALKTFPGLLTGIVAVGVGFIKLLQNINTEAEASVKSITELSAGIETKFKNSLLAIQKIRQTAAGDVGGALKTGAELEIQQATQAATKALAKANEELQKAAKPSVFSLEWWDPGVYETKQSLAMSKFASDKADIETDLAIKIRTVREQLVADTQKLYDDELKDFQQKEDEKTKKAQEEAEKQQKAAEEAAEAQKKLFHDVALSAGDMLKDLPGGEELEKKLGFEAWAQKTRDNIAQLNDVIAKGGDTTGLYAKEVEFLTKTLDTATKTGVIPMKEETKKLADAENEAAEAAKKRAAAIAYGNEQVGKALDAAAEARKARGELEQKSTLERIEAERKAAVDLAALDRKAADERMDVIFILTQSAAKAIAYRQAEEEKALNNIVIAEVKAAEARRAAIESMTASVLGIVDKLGAGFEPLAQKLHVAQFVQETTRALELINQNKDALRQLGVTESEVAQLTGTLTDQIRQAIDQGYVPQKKAIDDVNNSAQGATASLHQMTAAAGEAITSWKQGSQLRASTTQGLPPGAPITFGQASPSPSISGPSIFGGSGSINLQPWMDRIAAQTANSRVSVGVGTQNNTIHVTPAADPEETARRILPVMRQYASRGVL